MKQSDFDKWLTTEPIQIGVWGLIDQIATKRHKKVDDKVCSCCDWNEELKLWNCTEFCEIHAEEAK